MLLIIQFISLCGLTFAQYYNGHSLMANEDDQVLPYNSGSGDTETLPISEEELAQLMAQSLASSSGSYRQPRQSGHSGHSAPLANSDSNYGSNYDGAMGQDDGGSDGAINHNPPEEYSNEGQYGPQDSAEGSPDQQDGHSNEPQDGSHYQQQEPQQNYGDNNDRYQSSPQGYQQEDGQYPSGQYPDSQSGGYDDQNNEGPSYRGSHSGPYDDQSDSQYDQKPRRQTYGPQSQQSGYQSESPPRYSSAADPYQNRYKHDPDSSYSAPGAGYSGAESESSLSYDVKHLPKSKYYRN